MDAEARRKAIEEQKKRLAEKRLAEEAEQRKALEAKRKALEEKRLAEEAAARKKAEEEEAARKKAEEEAAAAKKAEEEAAARMKAEAEAVAERARAMEEAAAARAAEAEAARAAAAEVALEGEGDEDAAAELQDMIDSGKRGDALVEACAAAGMLPSVQVLARVCWDAVTAAGKEATEADEEDEEGREAVVKCLRVGELGALVQAAMWFEPVRVQLDFVYALQALWFENGSPSRVLRAVMWTLGRQGLLPMTTLGQWPDERDAKGTQDALFECSMVMARVRAEVAENEEEEEEEAFTELDITSSGVGVKDVSKRKAPVVVEEDLRCEIRGFHPLRALQFEQLMAAPDRQPHIPLSPEELIALYRSLRWAASATAGADWVSARLNGPLSPERVLAGKRWLRREEVRDYESALKTFFFSLASRAPTNAPLRTVVRRCLVKLGSTDMGLSAEPVSEPIADDDVDHPDKDATTTTSGSSEYRKLTRALTAGELQRGVVNLLDRLKELKRFPAILFRLDRNDCAAMAERALSYLEDKQELERVRTGWYATKARELEERQSQWDKFKKDHASKKSDNEKNKVLREMQAVGLTLEHRPEMDDLDSVDNEFAYFPERRGVVLSDDLALLREKTISTMGSKSILIRALARGIGIHHEVMPEPGRRLVEYMFRSGMLGAVISTSTLSMGIHAPCKTVVFLGDSPQLTPQLYRQMAGRAGRRGFDKHGQVVFYGVPFDRISLLTTANVANMLGHDALSVSTLLRLLRRRSNYFDDEDRATFDGVLRGMLDAPLAAVSSRATGAARLSLPDPEEAMRDACELLSDLTAASLQFLARRGMIHAKTMRPTRMALMQIRCVDKDPYTFIVSELLRCGALEPLCAGVTKRGVDEHFKNAVRNVLIVLARCFARVPIDPVSRRVADDTSDRDASNLVLPDCPPSVRDAVAQMSADVRDTLQSAIRAHLHARLRRGREAAVAEARAAARDAARAEREAAGAGARAGMGAGASDSEEEEEAVDIMAVGAGEMEAALAEEDVARRGGAAAVAAAEAAEAGDEAVSSVPALVELNSGRLPATGTLLGADTEGADVDVSAVRALLGDRAAEVVAQVAERADVGPLATDASEAEMERYLSTLQERVSLRLGVPLPMIDTGDFNRPLNGYILEAYSGSSFLRIQRGCRISDPFKHIEEFVDVCAALGKFVPVVLRAGSPVRIVLSEIVEQVKKVRDAVSESAKMAANST